MQCCTEPLCAVVRKAGASFRVRRRNLWAEAALRPASAQCYRGARMLQLSREEQLRSAFALARDG